MSKSIKFTNDTYLDSSGLTFEKTPFNKILTYSTEEVIIGKWIDGKPIYRKVVPVNFGISGTRIETAHNISNLDFVIKQILIWYDTTDNGWFYSDKDKGINTYTVYINNVSSSNIVIGQNSYDWQTRTKNRYAILEYTKTTDIVEEVTNE